MNPPPHSDPRFQSWENTIHAFVTLCDVSPDHGSSKGSDALVGVTVGVKDIIDVAGTPTRNGSAAYKDAPVAEQDAAVVAKLRKAGAQIVGKTVTTEFAFVDPTGCRNPYDPDRTPGGSSSGSGAAVAAGLVDVALGTQTAGSLCRPAAYCGVVGLKPTYGFLSTSGVTPLAPSFDSVGIIASSVDLARRAFEIVVDARPDAPRKKTFRAARLLFQTEVTATKDALAALENAAVALSREASPIQTITTDADIKTIVDAHRTVMLTEAASAHGHLLQGSSAKALMPRFREALTKGQALTPNEIHDARNTLVRASALFWDEMAEWDVLLTLPVPDGAPLLDGTTGFQDWLTPWTVFGGPLVSLPWGLDSLGRPRAVMLAGRPGTDAALLDVAAMLEAGAPPMPPPTLPR